MARKYVKFVSDNAVLSRYGRSLHRLVEYVSTPGLLYTRHQDDSGLYYYSCDGIGDAQTGDIVVADTVDGILVTQINEDAFSDCTRLTSIIIHDSVTTIGKAAFSGCTGLTSITIPFVGAFKDGTSDTYFGHIFGASSTYDNINRVPSSLHTVVITGGSRIENYAFFGCTSLTEVVIPDSVTYLGDNAFRECAGLTSITIPDSVITLGSLAFCGCTGLTSVTIGNGVTAIGNSVFSHCTSLTSVEIPDSVTTIGMGAFYQCTSLTSVEIPDSVTTIGNVAFQDCGTLQIKFFGTEEQWNNISKGSNWNSGTTVSVIYG